MATSRGNVHSDTAKKEQIITEFFTKTLQIILESRSPYMSSRNFSVEQAVSSPSSSSSSSSFRTRDKWFNLALRECPAALENIDFWRQSNLEPMVVDIMLAEREWDPVGLYPRGYFGKSTKELGPENEVGSMSEKVIERWVVQYDGGKSLEGKKTSGNLHTLYKKSIVLLRSLYTTVRLLPGYKVYRDLISSGQIRNFTLTHRVSSFFEPFTRREESDMTRFTFTPIDTSCGRICLSVLYRPTICEITLEPSTPMSPQFIMDYVGSPLADPLRRLPRSPSCSPFSRRHSWSFENYRVPSGVPSPSPTYSDSHSLVSKCGARVRPPAGLSCRDKSGGFDECWPSPLFSPGFSPSPSKELLRSESAPVSIPMAKGLSKQSLPPSPPMKLTRAATLKLDKCAGPTGLSLEKYSSESERLCGARLSSNSSPRVSISRSSSRLSIQDDFDDSEIACPFIVYDDDIMDRGSRPGSYDQKGKVGPTTEPGGVGPTQVRQSQDAAVGALVLMLKKAPPLRQDSLQPCKPSAEAVAKTDELPRNLPEARTHASSGSSKTTADALAELRGYKDLKELLINQSGSGEKEVFRDNSHNSGKF